MKFFTESFDGADLHTVMNSSERGRQSSKSFRVHPPRSRGVSLQASLWRRMSK